MTNKDLIALLSGFSMKSELEVVQGDSCYEIEEVKRVYIPEEKDDHGRKIPARNIVQIILKK